MMHARLSVLALLAATFLLFAACTDPANIATGGAGGGGTSSASSTGGHGGSLCTPGATMACYSGPAGTEGIGACRAGQKTCDAAGAAWGACVGEVLPSAEDCSTPEDDECTGNIAPCGASTTWSKHFADAADNPSASWSVALDDAADVFFCGSFAGAASFDGSTLSSTGPRDIFLAKLSPSGAQQWSKHLAADATSPLLAANGLGEIVVAAGVAGPIDLGGGPLTGQDLLHDLVIAKLDKDGQYVWAKRAVKMGTALYPTALTTAPNGDILMTVPNAALLDLGCGPTSLPAGFGGGSIVAKLDKDGKCLWSKGIASNQLVAEKIGFDASGNVLVAGSFGSSADFGGGPVFSGNYTSYLFLEKRAPDGTHLTTKIWGGYWSQLPAVKGLAVDATGNIILTGTFDASSPLDFGQGPITSANAYASAYLAKLDQSGAGLWSKAFGPGNTAGLDVALTPGGDIVALGQLQGSADLGTGTLTGNPGLYLARFSASGTIASASAFQGVKSARLSVDGKGNAVIAGGFVESIDLGTGMLVSAGGLDGFVANLGH
ncbi:Tryptophan synthase alpha chain [Minicystis rosea]|nr:Tryptophan synthase alpha chain [Minicystis rosea]